MNIGRLFGVLGGLIGIGALFLPWITLTAVGFVSLQINMSPFDLAMEIYSGVQESGSSIFDLPEDPAQQRFAIGLYVALVGSAIFFIGSLVSLVKPHGGIAMIVGAIVFLGGSTMLSVSGPAIIQSISFGVGYGIGVAYIAGGLATVGVFLKERRLTLVIAERQSSTIMCQNCLGENQPHARFCSSCGNALS